MLFRILREICSSRKTLARYILGSVWWKKLGQVKQSILEILVESSIDALQTSYYLCKTEYAPALGKRLALLLVYVVNWTAFAILLNVAEHINSVDLACVVAVAAAISIAASNMLLCWSLSLMQLAKWD